MENTAKYIEEASKCVRCGICKSFCPTYDVLRREPSGPRGRLSLAEARLTGEGGFGQAYVRHMKECTLCGACYSNCPNGVNIPELVLAARAETVERGGLSMGASFVLRNILPSARFMPMALRFASKLQGAFFKGSGSGLLSRLDLPLVGRGRLVPELSERFFLDRPHIKALGGQGKGRGVVAKAKVAFYVGCGINYFLPDIGEATLRVLKEGGAEVMVPEGQVCCGMPVFSAGDRDTAKSLAIKNLEVFEKIDSDYIVTSCATCGHGLRNVFRELLSDDGPEMKGRVERFSSRVRDVTELLCRELPYEGIGRVGSREFVATYHDPCHLRRYQGVSEEPRRLIESSGARFRGLKHPCRCCGFGGGLSLENYELSMEIARMKAEDVRETGADVVATACPGCIIQIKDALHRFGVKANVAHVVELL